MYVLNIYGITWYRIIFINKISKFKMNKNVQTHSTMKIVMQFEKKPVYIIQVFFK